MKNDEKSSIFKKEMFWGKLIKFLQALALIIVISSFAFYFYNEWPEQEGYTRDELRYWECKSKIVDEIEFFINKKASYASIDPVLVIRNSDKYDIDPRLFLAQGLLESHFGTKGLARKTNSVCNVGAWDDGTITHTYDHPNLSIEPYFKLLRNNYLVDKTEEELLQNFVNKDGNRYASYALYEKELKIVWEEINKITKLDSLLQAYRFYKLQLYR